MKNWLKQPANAVILFLILIYLFRLVFQPHSGIKDGQTVRVAGNIVQAPQYSAKAQMFYLGKIKTVTQKYPEYEIGDRIIASGVIQVTPIFNIKQLNWLKEEPVMVFPKISKQGQRQSASILSLSDRLKRRLLTVYSGLPSPADGLLAGIVLGDKSLLSVQTKDQLINTGTYHLAVASGMNIALLAQGFLGLLAWRINRRKALVITIALIWLYTLVAGLTVPLIRASLMLSLVYLMQISGRESFGGRVLLLTGLTMLIINPTLLFSVSFQLSFTATLGLVYLQPVFKRMKPLRNEAISGTLAAQIMTLPIIISIFGQFNLLAPIINLSVVCLMPFILGGGLIVGVIGLISQSFGITLSYLLFPALFGVSQAISRFAKISGFLVRNISIPWWFWFGYYGAAGGYIKIKNKNIKISCLNRY